MIDFSTRAHTPELMDGPCAYEEFRDCLVDLAKVNRATFAYYPTLYWLKHLTGAPVLRILDVGSGYGDMLRRIGQWAARHGQKVELTGVDLNPYAARAAAAATPEGGIAWATSNAFSYSAADDIDAIICSLFTHHLTDDEIVRYLQWAEATARRGWFISDLHRHPLPYYVFRVWTRLAGWHRFVQSDGPISITRSFRRADWTRLCKAAGLPMDQVKIRWRMPFRYCIGRIKK
jgi:SAM-dependent methyltransferase